jgi:hypothetical protein
LHLTNRIASAHRALAEIGEYQMARHAKGPFRPFDLRCCTGADSRWLAIPAIDPATGRDLRAESEHHWRLMMECGDDLETKIVDLYDAGADLPAARPSLIP